VKYVEHKRHFLVLPAQRTNRWQSDLVVASFEMMREGAGKN